MDLRVGQTATRSITLTEEHVKNFAEISGDYNPLHFDETFAAQTKFGRLVVQGGLTTGLLHALVAMDMPGPGTVFLSQNWKFTALFSSATQLPPRPRSRAFTHRSP